MRRRPYRLGGTWPGHHGKVPSTHDPEAKQCCSGAQWVPLGMLEERCGLRLGLRGLSMVYQGLPHHHPQEFSYIRPPDVTVRIQCTYLIYRINDYTMPKCRRLGQ